MTPIAGHAVAFERESPLVPPGVGALHATCKAGFDQAPQHFPGTCLTFTCSAAVHRRHVRPQSHARLRRRPVVPRHPRPETRGPLANDRLGSASATRDGHMRARREACEHHFARQGLPRPFASGFPSTSPFPTIPPPAQRRCTPSRSAECGVRSAGVQRRCAPSPDVGGARPRLGAGAPRRAAPLAPP